MKALALGVALGLWGFLATGVWADSPRIHSPVSDGESPVLEELARQVQDFARRWREHFLGRASPQERPLISFMLRHRKELGLSGEQVRGLEQLRSDYERERIRAEAEIRVAEMDVDRLLEADPVDLGKVEEKLREIERLRADLRLARIRTIQEGKKLLSPEQRKKLETLLAEAYRRREQPTQS